jgi:hypothetical protein
MIFVTLRRKGAKSAKWIWGGGEEKQNIESRTSNVQHRRRQNYFKFLDCFKSFLYFSMFDANSLTFAEGDKFYCVMTATKIKF